MKALIISNDMEQVAQLYPLLNKEGFDTLVEMYGKDGVIAAHGFEPDVVLLDAVLKEGMYVPVAGWEQVLAELKASAKTKHIPVILLDVLPVGGTRHRATGVYSVEDRISTSPAKLAAVCHEAAMAPGK